MQKKNTGFKWLLIPFAMFYRFAVAVRNLLFDWRILQSKEFDIPVISVGNISAGGTGKTPHVEYIVSILQNRFKVATLSRGYKRKSKGFVIAKPDSTLAQIGDEAKQVKRKFPDITVAVEASRVKGIKRLMAEKDLNAIILDDAFQHRYVNPGLSILLIDYNRPLEEDSFLPYGRLREHPRERRRADLILITKTPENIKPIDQRIIVKNMKLYPYQNLFFTTLQYANLAPVFPEKALTITTNDLERATYHILLISGIAQPKPLLDHLKKYTPDIKHLKYPDHYNFSKKDIQNIQKEFQAIKNPRKIVLTTEKDAMRLEENNHFDEAIKEKIFYIPAKVKILDNDRKDFRERIESFVKNNKRKNPYVID